MAPKQGVYSALMRGLARVRRKKKASWTMGRFTHPACLVEPTKIHIQVLHHAHNDYGVIAIMGVTPPFITS